MAGEDLRAGAVPGAGLLEDRPPARPLPFVTYPRARDVGSHGLQPLPPALPPLDLEGSRPHRSRRYEAVVLAGLAPAQMLRTARVVAASFVRREPQARHLRPPRHPPAGLMQTRHADPFGTFAFGDWNAGSLMYWIVHLTALTDPSSPSGGVRVNDEALGLSVAILDGDGRPLGGAFNERMPPPGAAPEMRMDPFMAAAFGWSAAIYGRFERQDAAAAGRLSERYGAFREALLAGRVGHHLLVARGDALAKEDAFELVAASAELLRDRGYEYVITEATNAWTGAAFEVLGGVRVHFDPFRARRVVPASAGPLEDVTTSPDGYIADRDSGSMLYVLRLA